MKILFVASEAHPFIKVGGLGDVAYALPKALINLGIDVRVIMPKYKVIKDKYEKGLSNLGEFNVPVGWRNQYGRLQYMEYDKIPFYFVDNEYYFNRTDAYGYGDDGERFAYFSRAVLESIRSMDGFIPDIIHCNDWHSAAIVPILKAHFQWDKLYSNIKTLFTVHNLQYQGIFPKACLWELMGLDHEYASYDKLGLGDGISYMKGALNMADKISTVSETYAEEIKTPYFGEGLDDLLRYRNWDLSGIINGIDTELFNPQKDKELKYKYNENNLQNKVKNKLELQKKLNLTVDENIPMIGIVSRLVGQKGLDLIACVIEEILKLNIQLVVLGTGDNQFENMFRYYAEKNPKKLSANIFFNNELAKNIYASSDMFLMPSKFEPCGIGQLLAFRYGSIPIVRETGGLKDTVTAYDYETGEGNGFSFTNYNAHDMLHTIEKAVKTYNDKKVWNKIVTRAMKEDNSWNRSARKYLELYNDIKGNQG